MGEAYSPSSFFGFALASRFNLSSKAASFSSTPRSRALSMNFSRWLFFALVFLVLILCFRFGFGSLSHLRLR